MSRSKHWLVGLVLSLVLLAPVACSKDETVMPDLSGMREIEATEALKNAGIDDWTVGFSQGPNPMVVTDTNPEAGEAVEPDTEVKITLDGR